MSNMLIVLTSQEEYNKCREGYQSYQIEKHTKFMSNWSKIGRRLTNYLSR